MRTRNITVPTLLLSALGQVSDRITGLRAGADDYLVKPFALGELMARIEVLPSAARPGERRPGLHVGPLELDLIARRASRGGRTLDLLAREFQLLEYLMRCDGMPVTRKMLLEDVFGYRFELRTNLIDVHMGRLRRKTRCSGRTAPAAHPAGRRLHPQCPAVAAPKRLRVPEACCAAVGCGGAWPFAVVLGTSLLSMFALMFWRSSHLLFDTIDRSVTEQVELLAARPPDMLVFMISSRMNHRPAVVTQVGLFAHDGTAIVGDISVIPEGIDLTGRVLPVPAPGDPTIHWRAAGRRLADGRVLVAARGGRTRYWRCDRT